MTKIDKRFKRPCLICDVLGHNGDGCPLRVTVCLTCGESGQDHHKISCHSWDRHDSGRVQRIRMDTTTTEQERLVMAREINARNVAKRGFA